MHHSYLDSFLGDICPAGHYCPRGSRQPTPCTGGMYCPHAGLSAPHGNCSAGYYCNDSSTVPTQHQCYPGHYCPSGSENPISCEVGTYATGSGNTQKNDCVKCTAGRYCDKRGMASTAGPCGPGYVAISGRYHKLLF